jgi:hypothetical protein
MSLRLERSLLRRVDAYAKAKGWTRTTAIAVLLDEGLAKAPRTMSGRGPNLDLGTTRTEPREEVEARVEMEPSAHEEQGVGVPGDASPSAPAPCLHRNRKDLGYAVRCLDCGVRL